VDSEAAGGAVDLEAQTVTISAAVSHHPDPAAPRLRR
jgi:hypothetical protein